MNAPQIIIIVLMAMSVTLSLAKHGEPRPPYHAGYTIVSACIWGFVLHTGGFFG